MHTHQNRGEGKRGNRVEDGGDGVERRSDGWVDEQFGRSLQNRVTGLENRRDSVSRNLLRHRVLGLYCVAHTMIARRLR
jgi:hypothetical protein